MGRITSKPKVRWKTKRAARKSRAKAHPKPFEGAGKYAPKLTFEQRCKLYAAGKNGTPREAIQRIAAIDSSSLTRLLDDKYRSYKTVRDEYKRMGHSSFIEKYPPD